MTRKKDHGVRMVREALAGSRRPAARGPSFTGAADVFAHLGPSMADAQQETFIAILLDTKNRMFETVVVSLGTLDASLVHPRDTFRQAVKTSAAAIIVVHNHPSGCSEPSAEDIALTRRLADCGELLGIPLLDSIVIGAGEFVSLAERGVV